MSACYIYKMQTYQTKINKLNGTNFHEVRKKAFGIYLELKRKTKRKTYIRSRYFKKDKIFLDTDLTRRMKFYPCALDLIKNSHFEPASKENPNKKSEILHRFAGITPDKEVFFVQIKEMKNTNKKWLISVFPV